MKVLQFVVVLVGYINFTLSSKVMEDLATKRNNIKSTIKKLEKSILAEQSQHEVKFRSIPPKFNEIEGIFHSYIHLNFSGEKNNLPNYATREKLKCLDMNMFVTNFVLNIFYEASELKAIEFNKAVYLKAFKGMLQFKDKNYQNDVPIYTFWRQKNFGKYWKQYPDTMVGLMNHQPNTKNLIRILKKLGFNHIAKFIESFNAYWDMFAKAYIIPSDLDDTFTSLALTAQLNKLNDKDIKQEWIDKNSNIKELFNTVKSLTWKPFSDEKAKFPIDPRTYFWIHDYLMKKRSEGKLNLSIPITWLWTLDQEKESYEYVLMPFITNNVDMNVISNFLFGMSNLIIFTPENKIHIDEDIIEMINNVADLIEWVIANDVVIKRPDITLLYYPSIWDFYWMVSRISSLIKNEIELSETRSENDSIDKLLLDINERLKSVLSAHTTKYLFDQIKYTKENEAFVAEFLGNYANKTRNEDALFASGLAFNSLLNIFTYKKNGKIYYEQSATEEIKLVIDSFANYILNQNNKHGVSKEGAFFSGSVHTTHSGLPYFYPANYFKNLNGTDFKPNDWSIMTVSSIVGVDKFIEDDAFKQMIKEKHYGVDTPIEADYINNSTFPFWSAPALTESLSLLGLAKYRLLIENN